MCCSIHGVFLVTEHDRATSHNQDMITLLRDLRSQVSTERQARIDDLLASVSHVHHDTENSTDQRRPLKMSLMPQPPSETQYTNTVRWGMGREAKPTQAQKLQAPGNKTYLMKTSCETRRQQLSRLKYNGCENYMVRVPRIYTEKALGAHLATTNQRSMDVWKRIGEKTAITLHLLCCRPVK